jgi:alpha-L-rhamnosidase
MTPDWKDAFKYAIHIGDQSGMEMAIAGSPG